VPIDAKVVERLYLRAGAAHWRVPRHRFTEALERAAEHGADLTALHLADLALACACDEGDEAAWEHFIREYRPTLYRAADALDPAGAARDLADGIYGELFERSLFRYFQGRSSLATWLRAVLAQRHVDRVRTQRRLEPLPDEDRPGPVVLAEAGDLNPERRRFFELIEAALKSAVEQLPSRDRLRLACYYAQQLTLAETGKLLGEHEATCSRHLARTRKTLRGSITGTLRSQGLDEAEIAECIASVSEDAGELDLERMLSTSSTTATVRVATTSGLRKKSDLDRSAVRGRT
jgi:RNA polymerase sigma-70 factor (ECF subfamily)